MTKKVIAIIGSYRKNGIIDQGVEAVLSAARKRGAETEKIYLTDRHIKFCTNCRVCAAESPGERRGLCVLEDDMRELLNKIDGADGLVLASPVNFYTVTALMKRFVERLIVYAYWPWHQFAPKFRIKAKNKKAIVITSSACPAFIGRFLIPNAFQILKAAAQVMGARVVKAIYFGNVCKEEKQQLDKKQIGAAELAGGILI